MTSKPEIREPPVPVRYRWSELDGTAMNTVMWWDTDREDIFRSCMGVFGKDVMTIEYDNGQTIIVRAKP